MSNWAVVGMSDASAACDLQTAHRRPVTASLTYIKCASDCLEL